MCVHRLQPRDLRLLLSYLLHAVTREHRAGAAKGHIGPGYTDKQKAFIDFVLSQYVRLGVDELAQEKLTPLLKVKYHDAIQDAVDDLGGTEQARLETHISW